MLKKLYIILLFSHLCIADPIGDFSSSPKNDSSTAFISIGAVALIASIIIPIIFDVLSEMSEDELKKIDETAVVAIDIFSITAFTSICIYSAFELYSMGKDFYEYTHPSEEKKSREEQARKEIKFYEIKSIFLNCLIDNLKTPRNNEGIPAVCQDLARKFGELAGESELLKKIEDFKFVYKDLEC